MLAQSFDVGDQVPGRILDEAGARAAAPATALIEHHDAVVPGVEELPGALIGAGARTAVQEYRRLAGRITAFFIVNFMDVRDTQLPVPKGLDRRVQPAARGVALIVAGCFAHLGRAWYGFCGAD